MPFLFPGPSPSPHLRVLSAGFNRIGDWWVRTDRLRGFWRLYRCEQEGAGLRYGRKRFALPAGRLVVVPGHLEFDATLENEVDQLYVQFELVGWPSAAAAELLSTPAVLDEDPVRDALALVVRDSVSEGTTLYPIELGRIKALIHLSLTEILDRLPEERAQRLLRVAEGQRELLAVLGYIDEHLEDPLPNGVLAGVAGVSEGRFIRRFREATGLTPARYVQEKRVRQAAELLISSDESIDRIAEQCGFGNRYYFTRVFAKRIGIPPARYRSDRAYLPASPGDGLDSPD